MTTKEEMDDETSVMGQDWAWAEKKLNECVRVRRECWPGNLYLFAMHPNHWWLFENDQGRLILWAPADEDKEAADWCVELAQ